MKEYYALLREKGEYFAAELLINTDRDPIYRYASAYAEYFRHAVLTPYDDGRLYPCGHSISSNRENGYAGVRPEYPFTFSANMAPVQDIAPEAAALPDSAASLRTAVLFIETHTFI